MKEDIIKIAARFNDIFPNAQLTLGGSAALQIHLPTEAIRPKDIDLYVKLNITRKGFREVLETIIFKYEDIMFEEKEQDEVPEHAPYRMPEIRRRIKVIRYNALDVDFIFTSTMHTVSEWLLKHQASTLTELCYPLDTFDNTKMLKTPKSTDKFKLAIAGHAPVQLVMDPVKCSIAHARSVLDRCKRMGLEVYKV